MVHRKVLRDGSGGAGAHPGGRGQEMVVECEADNVAAVFLAERLRFPAPGLFGGSEGATGAVLIDGEPVNARQLQVLQRGSRVTIRTPGGGGYGLAES